MYIMCEWCVVLCCGVVLCCVVLCCVVLCCVVLCCVVLCCVTCHKLQGHQQRPQHRGHSFPCKEGQVGYDFFHQGVNCRGAPLIQQHPHQRLVDVERVLSTSTTSTTTITTEDLPEELDGATGL